MNPFPMWIVMFSVNKVEYIRITLWSFRLRNTTPSHLKVFLNENSLARVGPQKSTFKMADV